MSNPRTSSSNEKHEQSELYVRFIDTAMDSLIPRWIQRTEDIIFEKNLKVFCILMVFYPIYLLFVTRSLFLLVDDHERMSLFFVLLVSHVPVLFACIAMCITGIITIFEYIAVFIFLAIVVSSTNVSLAFVWVAAVSAAATLYNAWCSKLPKTVKLHYSTSNGVEIRTINIAKLLATPEESENSLEKPFLGTMYFITSKLQMDMEPSAFPQVKYSRVEEMLPSERFVYHKQKTEEWERFIADSDPIQRTLGRLVISKVYETSGGQLQNVLRRLGNSHVCETNGMIFVSYPDSAHSRRTLANCSRTMKFSSKKNNIFMMLVRDFFIAHYGKTDETYVLVPGSPAILIQGNEIDLKTFLGRVPMHQIYLLARRLYQFTKADLSFNCFAKLEKQLMIEKGLIPWQLEIFDGVKIKLPPMLLSSLASFEIGYLRILDEKYYNVGIDVLGQTVVLQKRESKIANPVILSNQNHDHLKMLPSLTDHFDVAIGGNHHEQEDNHFLNNDEFEQDLGCFRVEKGRAHNVAYVPQNYSFSELYNERFYAESMQELYESCKFGLKYGEQLSDAIRKCVAEEFMSDASKFYFTFAEAQKLLLTKWARLTDANCMGFTTWKGRRSTDGWSLLLHNDQLHIVKSSIPKTTSFTAGLSVVLFSVGVGVSQSGSELSENTRVTNLYDAVVKVAGSVHDLDKHISSEPEWYKPRAEKMEELLGAMLLVCTFLRGRVKAEGMFAGAASPSKKQNPQIVDFNVPVPFGLACSALCTELQSFAFTKLPHDFRDKMVLRPDSYLIFDKYHNYTLPLILGGDENDGELLKALRKSVEASEILPWKFEEFKLISLLRRWFYVWRN